jgi:hypothetical protein
MRAAGAELAEMNHVAANSIGGRLRLNAEGAIIRSAKVGVGGFSSSCDAPEAPLLQMIQAKNEQNMTRAIVFSSTEPEARDPGPRVGCEDRPCELNRH